MQSDEPLIIKPQAGDGVSAVDVLKEIAQVLKKRGYLLMHRSDATFLVKIESEELLTGRAVVAIRAITPKSIEYKELDWAPGRDWEKRMPS